MSQRKTKHGVIGTNVRAYKKSGNQPWAFSFNRQAPEIPAKCPRCGEQHFVHDAGQLVNGVSKSQCHGCDVGDSEARKSRSIAGAVGKSFDAPANTVRFAHNGRGVTSDSKDGPWGDMTRAEFISPGRYRIVGHEGKGDTSVYIVTRGPGEKFLKVMAWHAFRRLEESLPSDAAFTGPSFSWNDLKGENRRFMFDGRRMLIGMKGGTPSKGSHSTEWFDATGTNDGFDDAVRGWVGIGSRAKHGVIHFAPPIRGSTAQFDVGWDCLEWFRKHGATGKCVVRGFAGAWEQSLDAALGAASVVERIDRALEALGEGTGDRLLKSLRGKPVKLTMRAWYRTRDAAIMYDPSTAGYSLEKLNKSDAIILRQDLLAFRDAVGNDTLPAEFYKVVASHAASGRVPKDPYISRDVGWLLGAVNTYLETVD